MLLRDHYEFLLQRSSPPPAPQPAPAQGRENRREKRREVDLRGRLVWLDDGNRQQTTDAVICDRSSAGIGLRLDCALEPGQPVLLRMLGATPFKAVVRHCRPDGASWIVGVEVASADRRRFERRACDRQAVMRWRLPDGRVREQAIVIQDHSEGGLRLRSGEKLTCGTVIQVVLNGWRRFARVANCRSDGDAFRLGVQFVGPPRAEDSGETGRVDATASG